MLFNYELNDVRKSGKITICHEHIFVENRTSVTVDIRAEERQNYVLKWILRDTMRRKRSAPKRIMVSIRN